MKPKRLDRPDPAEAIFSFKPRWANAILRGLKRVELRHNAPTRPISKAWIYSSFPVQKIVGWFVPGRIFEPMDVEALFVRFGYAPIMGDEPAFDMYETVDTSLGPKPRGEVTMGQAIGALKLFRPIEILCPVALDRRVSPPGIGLGSTPTGERVGWKPPVSWRYCGREDGWLVNRAWGGEAGL